MSLNEKWSPHQHLTKKQRDWFHVRWTRMKDRLTRAKLYSVTCRACGSHLIDSTADPSFHIRKHEAETDCLKTRPTKVPIPIQKERHGYSH